MDNAENKGTTADAAKAAAKETAQRVKSVAQKAFGEMKNGGALAGFFNFDKLYFPSIARFLFIAIVILTCVGVVIGVLSGFIGMFSGFFGGIMTMVTSVIFGALGIIATRLWFELIMIGFKINDNLEKIRENSEK